MMLVIDASVTVAWAFDSESTDFTRAVEERVAREGAIAPGHWPVEVANALLVAERRKRADAPRTALFLDRLRAFPVTVDDAVAESWGNALGLAREHRLTVYDACYLALAMRTGHALATLDSDLVQAAKAAGVTLAGAAAAGPTSARGQTVQRA